MNQLEPREQFLRLILYGAKPMTTIKTSKLHPLYFPTYPRCHECQSIKVASARAEAAEAEGGCRRVQVKTLQQLSLFAAPVDPYQARVDAALFRSLHQIERADMRWSNHCKRGLTDAELKEAIAYEYGISGGGSHPEWYSYEGGADPKFWLDSIAACGKPTLRGKLLLERVREVLAIPYPLS
jgi:hypothetical protein